MTDWKMTDMLTMAYKAVGKCEFWTQIYLHITTTYSTFWYCVSQYELLSYDGFALVRCGHTRLCECCAPRVVVDMGSGCSVCKTDTTTVMWVFA